MLRAMLCCICLFAVNPPVGADQQVTSTATVIRLNVQPMATPKPALRYLLLPELKEMNPGNPIPNYLRCLMDQDFSADAEVLGSSALRQADRAARMDKPDWQILLKIKSDGINLLLPDLQKIRTLASALQVRFRDEIGLRRFDDAIATTKTMFAISRHMGEHPTLIGGLVGIAIAYVAIAPLEEMLEQPGCPNLYWALTNLPSPLVSLDKGMEGERLLILAEMRGLVENAPMSAQELRKLIAYLDELLKQAGVAKRNDGGVQGWINARMKDPTSVAAARRRLIDVGLAEEQLLKFPADQVILLDEKREFEVRRDEILKLMSLPTWQCITLTRQIKPAKERALFDDFVPALMRIRLAQGRIEQRIALLRHVEAIRDFAATHGGRLPEKLGDIELPLPNDPFTGKAFVYKVKGSTAHVQGTPPAGEEMTPGFTIHYELTMQK